MSRRTGIRQRIESGVLSLLIALLLTLSTSLAQQVSFQRLFDRSSLDMSFCVRQTADSGYIIAGQSETGAVVIRTTKHGDTLWTRTFSPPTGASIALSVVITDSEDFVVAGGFGFHIFKISSDGEFRWAKSYSREDNGWASAMAATLDGGFVLTGAIRSSNVYDIYVLKLDRDGDSLWAKAFSGPVPPTSVGVNATSDSGCIVVGSVGRGGPYPYNTYLARLTSRGDTVWTKLLLTNAESYGSSVQQTPDGGFIVAGSIFRSEGAGGYDGFLARATSNGDTVWTKIYSRMRGGVVTQTRDGGYVFAGLKLVQDTLARPYLLKTNAQGDTLWSRLFFCLNTGMATSVQQTFDDGYVLTGSTSNEHPAGWDIFLVKTDGSGLVSVGDEPASPRGFRLFQNYPNPFNPSTVIAFSIASPTHVRIKVYDILGREVATLVDKRLNAGDHRIVFDGRNLSSGVYMYRLTSENSYSETRKLILIR